MADEHPVQFCVYYDHQSDAILDYFPGEIQPELKAGINSFWNQDIPRRILKELSMAELTMQQLKAKIGHSNSTLHENILRLQDAGLIYTKIIYEGNKIRILAPRIIFVTKNPEFRTKVQRFFQGMWVNSDANKKIVNFLQDNPDKFFSSDQIAAKLNIPVDEVELILSNWDSQITRSLSDFLKQRPFEKKILYRGTP